MSWHSFRPFVLLAALMAGAALAPSSVLAQRGAAADRGDSVALTASAAPQDRVATADPSPTAVPRLAPAGLRPVQADRPDLAQQNRDGMGAGSNLALMGVGAAAVVVGLLIGGDGGTIVALTGGVIGLVGLYRYLR